MKKILTTILLTSAIWSNAQIKLNKGCRRAEQKQKKMILEAKKRGYEKEGVGYFFVDDKLFFNGVCVFDGKNWLTFK